MSSSASFDNLQESLYEAQQELKEAWKRQDKLEDWIREACSYLGEKLTSENQAAIDELRQRANKLA